MRTRGFIVALALVLAARMLAIVGPAIAQEVELLELRLRDGSIIYGIVVTTTTDRIRVRTTRGVEVDLARAEIASMKAERGEIVGGEFHPSDPNGTRLLFGPTGRALPRGDGYVGVYQAIMPFAQVGITDRISIGGGTPLLFTFADEQRPFWLTPKVQLLDRSRIKAAAGAIHVVLPGSGHQGVGYGVVTVGRSDRAITVGMGVGYREDDGEKGTTPMVMVGAERRVNRRVKLITENYVWAGGGGMVGGGVRLFREHRSVDLGIAVPLGLPEVVAIPVVNVVWTF